MSFWRSRAFRHPPKRSGASAHQRAHVVWAALSGACHYHPYDLAPTREELRGWRDVVLQVVERTERAWRLGDTSRAHPHDLGRV